MATLIALGAAAALLTQTGFAQSGSVDTTFMHRCGPDGAVNAVLAQTDGKVVFGGGFTSLDGIAAIRLARLNADGSLDTNFCAAASLNTPALSLAIQSDGRILLSGQFTTVNGVSRSRIARLNADGTLDTTFDPGTGFAGGSRIRNVYLALQPDGAVITWGSFALFNGVNRAGVARLTSTGGLDSGFDPAWGASTVYVKSVAFLGDGRIVTGGSSSSFGYLSRRNPDGTREMAWMSETGTDGDVYSLIRQADGKVLLGGSFTHANGAARTNLVRLNADGSLDTNFTASTSNSRDWIPALAVQADGKLLVGGSFTSLGGVNRTNLARLNVDGSLDAGFVADLSPPGDAEIDAICVQPDGKILVGGWFESINGAAVTNLARLNPDGSLDATFKTGAGPDDYVFALAVQADGMILLGGYFYQINGITQPHLARLGPDGQVDPSFNTAPSSLSDLGRRFLGKI